MRPRKRSTTVQFTVRLTVDQMQRFQDLQKSIHAETRSDLVDYLITFAESKRDDLESLFYSLIDRLSENVESRLQNLETVTQLHLALTDSFIKYAVTALPEVPAQLKDVARRRGIEAYQRINLTAAREFQRRRQTHAYDPDALGIADEIAPSS